jgi:tetratricopeptide (TPR) repeat protein
MITERSSLAGSPTRAYRFLVQPARALGYGFVQLGWRLVAPLVLVVMWLRRTRAPTDPRVCGGQVAPAELATTSMQPPQSLPVHHAHSVSDRVALPEVDCIEVDPEFSEPLYPTVFARLQLGPRSKLLDLRAATMIKLDLFEGLADAWKARPGTVPRLGVLLDYERWAVLRDAAARRLKPLVDEGVAVEFLYEQQINSLPAWFSHGHVHHDQIPAVLDWLRTRWHATAEWPAVLSTTAMLVHASAPTEDVPELLIEIAAIALSFGGMEAAEQAAGRARSALTWVGDQPSVTRCRALRSLATATLAKGEVEAGLAHLETAITAAVLINDPIEEASALHQIGFHAFSGRHFARAEDRFRRAIGVLSAADSPYLLATLYHGLAAALDAQRKNDEEAERHASAALELRWDKDSRLAHDDRALIARIRARRSSRRS